MLQFESQFTDQNLDLYPKLVRDIENSSNETLQNQLHQLENQKCFLSCPSCNFHSKKSQQLNQQKTKPFVTNGSVDLYPLKDRNHKNDISHKKLNLDNLTFSDQNDQDFIKIDQTMDDVQFHPALSRAVQNFGSPNQLQALNHKIHSSSLSCGNCGHIFS
ncbi:hypothetical protein HK099_005667 [Clydaea vesicula]|uniref:Uncharacterized protein n=1 Tax=Clydaea vesicula TaxID=447962 RepID=A0AAD5U3J9_9FUNG|nr:hypothetical protein HK099_005667 [Clydaea vesicula]KAJ3377863.1 hypothetical protein HDU92_007899 [Lobulomyces angularis]